MNVSVEKSDKDLIYIYYHTIERRRKQKDMKSAERKILKNERFNLEA